MTTVQKATGLVFFFYIFLSQIFNKICWGFCPYLKFISSFIMWHSEGSVDVLQTLLRLPTNTISLSAIFPFCFFFLCFHFFYFSCVIWGLRINCDLPGKWCWGCCSQPWHLGVQDPDWARRWWQPACSVSRPSCWHNHWKLLPFLGLKVKFILPPSRWEWRLVIQG